MGKLTSRKFWFALISMLCALILMITKQIDAILGMKIIMSSAAAYMGAEGVIDLGRQLKGK